VAVSLFNNGYTVVRQISGTLSLVVAASKAVTCGRLASVDVRLKGGLSCDGRWVVGRSRTGGLGKETLCHLHSSRNYAEAFKLFRAAGTSAMSLNVFLVDSNPRTATFVSCRGLQVRHCGRGQGSVA
jgi:hypothetical protein